MTQLILYSLIFGLGGYIWYKCEEHQNELREAESKRHDEEDLLDPDR